MFLKICRLILLLFSSPLAFGHGADTSGLISTIPPALPNTAQYSGTHTTLPAAPNSAPHSGPESGLLSNPVQLSDRLTYRPQLTINPNAEPIGPSQSIETQSLSPKTHATDLLSTLPTQNPSTAIFEFIENHQSMLRNSIGPIITALYEEDYIFAGRFLKRLVLPIACFDAPEITLAFMETDYVLRALHEVTFILFRFQFVPLMVFDISDGIFLNIRDQTAKFIELAAHMPNLVQIRNIMTVIPHSFLLNRPINSIPEKASVIANFKKTLHLFTVYLHNLVIPEMPYSYVDTDAEPAPPSTEPIVIS